MTTNYNNFTWSPRDSNNKVTNFFSATSAMYRYTVIGWWNNWCSLPASHAYSSCVAKAAQLPLPLFLSIKCGHLLQQIRWTTKTKTAAMTFTNKNFSNLLVILVEDVSKIYVSLNLLFIRRGPKGRNKKLCYIGAICPYLVIFGHMIYAVFFFFKSLVQFLYQIPRNSLCRDGSINQLVYNFMWFMMKNGNIPFSHITNFHINNRLLM